MGPLNSTRFTGHKIKLAGNIIKESILHPRSTSVLNKTTGDVITRTTSSPLTAKVVLERLKSIFTQLFKP